jgi:hypothetical protein
MRQNGGGEQPVLQRASAPQQLSEWAQLEPFLATDEDLYGPSYYPTFDNMAARSYFSSSAASSPLGGMKAGVAVGNQPSMLRTHVPYLKDLRMSREILVYQSAFSSPPPNVSSSSASSSAPATTLASRMMSLGAKTISGLSKTISLAVPSVHNAIADWDDGSSQRRASGLMGAPVTVGGKPLPSITVSCEEGKFARHFYELKEHREGYDTLSNVSGSGKSDEELSVLNDTTLVIPSWPERAATPEELAVEKQFADEAGYWQEVYWERIAEARKHQEHQEFMYHAAPHAPSAATNPRKNSVVFTRSGAALRSSAQTVVIAPQPPPNVMHPVSRKPSMPMMRRQPSQTATVVSALQSTSAAPRWSVSQKVDNAFRREVGSISSVSSSMMEHGSQTSSARTGSLRDLRKATLSQPKVTVRRDSVGHTATFPRIVRKIPGTTAEHQSPLKASNTIVVPFYRESPSERKMQGIGRRSVSPTEGANELTCSATVLTDPDTLDDRTDDGLPGGAGVLSSPSSNMPLIALQALSSTASTVEAADLNLQRSGTTTPDHEDSYRTNEYESSMNNSCTGVTNSKHHRSGHRGRHLRPPIPWPAEWTLPITFYARQISMIPFGDDQLDPAQQLWASSREPSESGDSMPGDDSAAVAADDVEATDEASTSKRTTQPDNMVTPARMGSLASSTAMSTAGGGPAALQHCISGSPLPQNQDAASPILYTDEGTSSPPHGGEQHGEVVGRLRATSDPTTEGAPSPVGRDDKQNGSSDNLFDRTQSSAVLPAAVVSPSNRSATQLEGASGNIVEINENEPNHPATRSKPVVVSKPQPKAPHIKPPTVAAATKQSSRSCCAMM